MFVFLKKFMCHSPNPECYCVLRWASKEVIKVK